MKFHYILTILNNYFDQFYWHSISKRFCAVAVWRNQGNCPVCKWSFSSWPDWKSSDWLEVCSIWDLAGFHFLVPKLYANLVMVHDLLETVLYWLEVFLNWGLAGFHFLVPRCEGSCIFIRSFVTLAMNCKTPKFCGLSLF